MSCETEKNSTILHDTDDEYDQNLLKYRNQKLGKIKSRK